MDSGLAVAGAQVDPDDYYLDLDADAGVEDFDFKLDGAYENEAPQGDPEEANVGEAANPTAGFEIGYEDDEAQPGPTEDGTAAQTSEAGLDVHEDTGMEYQDEIGYEDEEPTAADVDTNPEAGGTGTPSARQSPSTSEEHDEHQEAFYNDAQMLEAKAHGAVHQDPDAEDPNGEFLSHESLGDLKEEGMSELNGTPGLSVDPTDDGSIHQSLLSHGRTPASGLDDAEGASTDISNDSSAVPEVTVHYNQAVYSLIGGPTEDPDSYFLSDSKELDGSLSHLLASIRAVISDEVSSEDELVIHITTLGIEFGERSNKKFLDRSFRDIIACFAALESKHPADDRNALDLDLSVRRDCEARFAELLEEAGLAGAELSDHEEGFEGLDDNPSNAAEGEEQPDESSAGGYSNEYEAEGEDDAAAAPHDDVEQAAAGDEKWLESEVAPENGDDIMGESFDLQANVSGQDSTGLAPLGSVGEGIYEEQYLDVHYEGYDHTAGPEEDEAFVNEVEVSGGPEEELAADQTPEEPELTFELPEQPIEGHDSHQWGDETVEKGSFDGTAGAEPTSHDDDVSLMLDPDSTLATVREPNSAGDNADDGGSAQNGGVQQESSSLSFSQNINNSTAGSVSNQDQSAGLQEAVSGRTSRTSTVNGDEIDYEEHNLVDESFAPDQDAHQEVETLEEKRDEIDWENYGDEDEDQNAADLTPSSVSGKRGRTNEVESLADETDYKRRRT